MIHQEFNSVGGGHNDITYYHGSGFPMPHIHHSAELIYVTDGQVDIVINSLDVTAKKGEIALILPDQIHSFFMDENAKCFVQVFSTDCASGFFNALGSRIPRSPVIRCSDAALEYWKSCCLSLPADGSCRGLHSHFIVPPNISSFKLRSALYAVLSEYLDGELILRDGGHEQLFGKVAAYIIEHCTEDLTLESVSAYFGYEPHYFSRCLKQVSDFNFRRLINRCRIDIARDLLENEETSVTAISLACGYSCLRTFNRVFKQLEGCTPQEYRERFTKALLKT